MQIQNEMRRFY
uniref:Uncharacterized protein n=1 Tax=Lepeophtheirus salmonis TaxID=72036 RepID=A0A0K2UM63_LEPSM